MRANLVGISGLLLASSLSATCMAADTAGGQCNAGPSLLAAKDGVAWHEPDADADGRLDTVLTLTGVAVDKAKVGAAQTPAARRKAVGDQLWNAHALANLQLRITPAGEVVEYVFAYDGGADTKGGTAALGKATITRNDAERIAGSWELTASGEYDPACKVTFDVAYVDGAAASK